MLPCECSGLQPSNWHYMTGFWHALSTCGVSTWCHHTWPDLTGLSPPHLHTTSNEIKEWVWVLHGNEANMWVHCLGKHLISTLLLLGGRFSLHFHGVLVGWSRKWETARKLKLTLHILDGGERVNFKLVFNTIGSMWYNHLSWSEKVGSSFLSALYTGAEGPILTGVALPPSLDTFVTACYERACVHRLYMCIRWCVCIALTQAYPVFFVL